MESNPLVNNEATSSVAPVQSTTTEPEKGSAQTPKTPKLPWICVLISGIIAIAGLAFGIYGMTSSGNTANTENLKVQVKNADGSTTTLEADKIENKDGENIITVDEPLATKNPIITKTLEEDDSTAKYTMSKSFHIYDYNTGANYKLDVSIVNGEIEKCELIDPADQVSGDLLIRNCKIDGLSKKIYKMSTFAHGQLGNPPVAFILEDGTIEYFKLDDAINSATLTVKKAKTNGFVVDVVDELGVFTNSKDGTSPAGGVTTAIIYSDGTFDYYNPETMLPE